jgi:hypothetical protein
VTVASVDPDDYWVAIRGSAGGVRQDGRRPRLQANRLGVLIEGTDDRLYNLNAYGAGTSRLSSRCL